MIKALISGVALCLAWTSAASATVTFFAAPPYPVTPAQTVSTITMFNQQMGVTSSGDTFIQGALFDRINHGNVGQVSASGTPYVVSYAGGGLWGSFNINNFLTPGMGALVLEVTVNLSSASQLNLLALDSRGSVFNFTTNGVQGANTLYFLAEPLRVISNLSVYSTTNNISSVSNFQMTTSPTPEPASWALLILGFGAVGFAMRRRREIISAA